MNERALFGIGTRARAMDETSTAPARNSSLNWAHSCGSAAAALGSEGWKLHSVSLATTNVDQTSNTSGSVRSVSVLSLAALTKASITGVSDPKGVKAAI